MFMCQAAAGYIALHFFRSAFGVVINNECVDFESYIYAREVTPTNKIGEAIRGLNFKCSSFIDFLDCYFVRELFYIYIF